MSSIVIIDYGMGNIKSVQRGIEQVGATATLSADPGVISRAGHLILPGVGAFEDGMAGLEKYGLVEPILRFFESGKPLMGICLGMQMLLDKSEEHGEHQGLGLIPGVVEEIPRESNGVFRKIPHIGWSALKQVDGGCDWEDSYLSHTKIGDFVYFVHSYMAVPVHKQHLLSQCEYEGLSINAAIKRDNITGFQFHPEKSGVIGLKILKEFINS